MHISRLSYLENGKYCIWTTSQIQLGWEELFDELLLQASQHFESSEPQPEQSSGRLDRAALHNFYCLTCLAIGLAYLHMGAVGGCLTSRFLITSKTPADKPLSR